MKVNLLFFGIATDFVGATTAQLEVDELTSIKELKIKLVAVYPKLQNLSQFAVAVNENYATDDVQLKENDTIAIIPPVSGG